VSGTSSMRSRRRFNSFGPIAARRSCISNTLALFERLKVSFDLYASRDSLSCGQLIATCSLVSRDPLAFFYRRVVRAHNARLERKVRPHHCCVSSTLTRVEKQTQRPNLESTLNNSPKAALTPTGILKPHLWVPENKFRWMERTCDCKLAVVK
jgi:hypothetical protein